MVVARKSSSYTFDDLPRHYHRHITDESTRRELHLYLKLFRDDVTELAEMYRDQNFGMFVSILFNAYYTYEVAKTTIDLNHEIGIVNRNGKAVYMKELDGMRNDLETMVNMMLRHAGGVAHGGETAQE